MTDRYNGEYDDIINMEKPVSAKRVKMPMLDRAAQFAPFAALTGFDAQISETARLTEQRPVLSDYELEELNEKITLILGNIRSRPELEVIYFVKDSKKSGGAIEHYIGKIRKFDSYKRILIFEDCKNIYADDIIYIKSEIL